MPVRKVAFYSPKQVHNIDCKISLCSVKTHKKITGYPPYCREPNNASFSRWKEAQHQVQAQHLFSYAGT